VDDCGSPVQSSILLCVCVCVCAFVWRVPLSACAQPVCRRQAAQIQRERDQHAKLGNLFTVAFTVNLVMLRSAPRLPPALGASCVL
jgi:hypothetical protein